MGFDWFARLLRNRVTRFVLDDEYSDGPIGEFAEYVSN